MKLVLLLNNRKFVYDNYISLCEDWDNIKATCGWPGTCGDWRLYSLVIHDLHNQIEKYKPCNIWQSWWQPFNPTIALVYTTDQLAENF